VAGAWRPAGFLGARLRKAASLAGTVSIRTARAGSRRSRDTAPDCAALALSSRSGHRGKNRRGTPLEAPASQPARRTGREMGHERISAWTPPRAAPSPPASRDGRVCITTMASLARVLTPENRATVLPRFFHLSRQEAKVIAAELLPVANPPRRTVITTVHAASVARAPETTSQTVFLGEPNGPERSPAAASAIPPDPLLASDPAPAMRVEPLTATVRRVHLTVVAAPGRDRSHHPEGLRREVGAGEPSPPLCPPQQVGGSSEARPRADEQVLQGDPRQPLLAGLPGDASGG